MDEPLHSPNVPNPTPELHFASPRGLPRASKVEGRVVVLDIAFAASSGSGVSYERVTQPFIEGLGDRLAAWVDHHDHERHPEFAHDSRFVLATKAQHGACPEMVTEELVRQTGPIDSIVCHVDLDGLYSAAKWILGGNEPYQGADADARCIDTRLGEPGPRAMWIDRALRARFRDKDLKRAVVKWLTEGLGAGPHKDLISEAESEFAHRDRGTSALARRYVRRGRVSFVDASLQTEPYDKTDLLLRGQQDGAVAAVQDSGYVTLAASFESGWDFLDLLGLEGGMPTRVTVPEGRLDEAISVINAAPLPKPK